MQRPKSHILEHSRRKELIVRVLKDQPYIGPYARQVRFDDWESSYSYLARAVTQDAVEVEHQAAFTGPIWPYEGHFLSSHQPQIDAAQRHMAVRVLEMEVFD
jgi:hypothetical protein